MTGPNSAEDKSKIIKDHFPIYKASSTVMFLGGGINIKRQQKALNLLKSFATRRNISTRNPNWIQAAIEAAALEHPELAEHDLPRGRPRTQNKLIDFEQLLERRDTVSRDLEKRQGKPPSARQVHLELARQDYQERHRKPAQDEELEAAAASYKGRIDYATKAIKDYLSMLVAK